MRVRIEVVGAIQDESYVNSAMNQALYYTRHDIAAWHVSFGTQTLHSSSPNDGVRITENRSRSTFELVLDTDALDRSQPDQWVYTTTVKVQAFYGHLYKPHHAHKHTQKKTLVYCKLIFDKPVYRGALITIIPLKALLFRLKRVP